MADLDEMSRAIGALQAGQESLGRSMDQLRNEIHRDRVEDRQEHHEFRDSMERAITSMADAGRTQLHQLEQVSKEVVLLKRSDEATKKWIDGAQVAQIERRGAMKLGKLVWAAIVAVATLAGGVGWQFAQRIFK